MSIDSGRQFLFITIHTTNHNPMELLLEVLRIIMSGLTAAVLSASACLIVILWLVRRILQLLEPVLGAVKSVESIVNEANSIFGRKGLQASKQTRGFC